MMSTITEECEVEWRAPAAPVSWGLAAFFACIAPLAALVAWGVEVRRYLEFPPRTIYVEYAAFNWWWFFLYGVSALALLLFVARHVRVKRKAHEALGIRTVGAIVLLVFLWMIAWNRWDWAQSIQSHTFLGLWISYILLLNMVLREARGRCPLLDSPRQYCASFFISGLFWWTFEFLNRFTQNWRYLNVESYSPITYAVLASLSFCTVLPSVWVTKELFVELFLESRYPRLELNLSPAAAWFGFGVSMILFCALPIFPDYFFASIWIAPITLVVSINTLIQKRSIVLCDPALWALSALWCGVWWEMWNSSSFVQWTYVVPFVDWCRIFEMPLLGYGGYLPFGMLCGMLIESLEGRGKVYGDEKKDQ